MRRAPALLGLLVVLLGGCSVQPPSDPLEGVEADFTFAVMGDLPYTASSELAFPWVVASMERQEPAFVIHVGDIKGGSVPCTDSLLLDRHEALAAVDLPMVYLPGDNEWTDCHRNPAGVHDPLERLDELRGLFYPEAGSSTVGGRPMAVERQSDDPEWQEFSEHQRWRRHGLVFTALHVVGSRNGLAPFPGRTADHEAEVDRRIEAAVLWLRAAFRQAQELDAPAVVVALHANPWIETAEPSGFEEILAVLAEEAQAFARPVLVVHGDTHTYRVDRPLVDAAGQTVENVVRLETYGDPVAGWVEVAVDVDAPGVFTVAPRPID